MKTGSRDIEAKKLLVLISWKLSKRVTGEVVVFKAWHQLIFVLLLFALCFCRGKRERSVSSNAK